MTKRREIDAAPKPNGALEALREQATVADPAHRYQVHRNQIYSWKEPREAGGAGVGSEGRPGGRRLVGTAIEKLHAKIGQLTIENDSSPSCLEGERAGPGAKLVRNHHICRCSGNARCSVLPAPVSIGWRARRETVAAHRRAVHAMAVPPLTADHGEAAGGGRASATADAADGHCRAAPRAEGRGPPSRRRGTGSIRIFCATDGRSAEFAADITHSPLGRGFLYLVATGRRYRCGAPASRTSG